MAVVHVSAVVIKLVLGHEEDALALALVRVLSVPANDVVLVALVFGENEGKAVRLEDLGTGLQTRHDLVGTRDFPVLDRLFRVRV